MFIIFGAVGVLWVQWVGLGIYKRGGAMPDTPEDAVGPTAAVTGLTVGLYKLNQAGPIIA